MAQSIEVRLRADSAGSPVAGALVRLVGLRGTVAQGLSSEAGRVVLRAPTAGEYRVKVDRIGWAGITAGPYALEAGVQIRREIQLPSERLALPSIEVAGASRCETMARGGPLAAALWEEIRKALTASVITSARSPIPLHVKTFNRDLDSERRPVRERLELSAVLAGHRYAALPSAELARRGFVFATDTSTVYAAPDAELLLSDAFVDRHCFRAVPGAGALVGLGFQPLRGIKHIDVRGTLWVDRTTSELDFLEYRYTGIPDTTLGGRVAFHRLPDGGWIVSSWHIRSAHFEITDATNSGRRESRLAGYRERGANVEQATDSLGRVERAFIAGRVWDSIANKGLWDATISVDGLPDSIISDREGRFGMAVRDTGARLLEARHWKLELLGMTPGGTLALRWGDTARVEFGVPSLATLAGQLCGRPEDKSGVIGVLRRQDGGAVELFEVHAGWEALDGNHREVAAPRVNGLFAICWRSQPIFPVQLQIRNIRRELVRSTVRPRFGFQWVEIAIP